MRTDRQTGRHDEANRRFSQLREKRIIKERKMNCALDTSNLHSRGNLGTCLVHATVQP